MPTTTDQYSGTRRAFSASARYTEDWTKISDATERRKVQNRIAQRNYRKKMKKRSAYLDVSSSASPKQLTGFPYSKESQPYRRVSEEYQHQFSPYKNQTMFSHQHTRQLSLSPPPVLDSAYSTLETDAYYLPRTPCRSGPITASRTPEMPTYTPYLQAPDDDISPLNLTYAKMEGLEIPSSKVRASSGSSVAYRW